MEIDRQIAYYDKRWSETSYPNELDLIRCNEVLRRLEAAKLFAPRICDLGCGTGWLTSILSAFGPSLGIDFSGSAIQNAAERYPSASFLQADLSQWDAGDKAGQFDVVVSVEVVEHLDDQQRYIDLAAKLLKPSGLLILTTPNLRTMDAMPTGAPKAWSNQPLENWIDAGQLRSLLKPSFSEISIGSVALGFGRRGSYRLVNSGKLHRAVSSFGLGRLWAGMRNEMLYGLHLAVSARKRA